MSIRGLALDAGREIDGICEGQEISKMSFRPADRLSEGGKQL
jgi:hypothetical protein